MGGVRHYIATGLAVASLFLSSCNSIFNPKVDYNNLEKIAATETVDVEIVLPTVEDKVTETPFATETTESTPIPTETPVPILTPAPTGSLYDPKCEYELIFKEDITIDDDSVLNPNRSFSKTWLVENTGGCDIDGAVLSHVSGSVLEGETKKLPYIAVGAKIEITLDLVTPATVGFYKSTWQPMFITETEEVTIGDKLWTQFFVMDPEVIEKFLLVDLSRQMVYAFDDAKLKHSYYVSTGMANTPTVQNIFGEPFKIYAKFTSQTMDGRRLGYDYYLPGVPYVMYFFQDYSFHGTYWHNNFGTPMSHGCVNMYTPQAKKLFEEYTHGDPVYVVDRLENFYKNFEIKAENN